jgi:hypothetical protein
MARNTGQENIRIVKDPNPRGGNNTNKIKPIKSFHFEVKEIAVRREPG